MIIHSGIGLKGRGRGFVVGGTAHVGIYAVEDQQPLVGHCVAKEFVRLHDSTAKGAVTAENRPAYWGALEW